MKKLRIREKTKKTNYKKRLKRIKSFLTYKTLFFRKTNKKIFIQVSSFSLEKNDTCEYFLSSKTPSFLNFFALNPKKNMKNLEVCYLLGVFFSKNYKSSSFLILDVNFTFKFSKKIIFFLEGYLRSSPEPKIKVDSLKINQIFNSVYSKKKFTFLN